jgi:hypothetical protein
MNDTPRTNNFKSQGREWLPLGIFEKGERENSQLRELVMRYIGTTQQVHPWTPKKSQCREILRILPRHGKMRDVWRMLESASERGAVESIGCDDLFCVVLRGRVTSPNRPCGEDQ